MTGLKSHEVNVLPRRPVSPVTEAVFRKGVELDAPAKASRIAPSQRKAGSVLAESDRERVTSSCRGHITHHWHWTLGPVCVMRMLGE